MVGVLRYGQVNIGPIVCAVKKTKLGLFYSYYLICYRRVLTLINSNYQIFTLCVKQKFNLKGQYHGHSVIFKGLKMTFRTKILKKNYTTLISIKNTINFVLTTFPYGDFFFDRALDCGQVEF